MSVTDTAQVHLPPVDAICPDGHRTSVQAPSGKRVKCGRCAEAGQVVMVKVPPRPGAVQAPEPRPAARTAECRQCGKTGPVPPGGRVPRGWLTVWISADPERDPKGRDRITLGPWCSARCAAVALAQRAGAGKPARPPGRDDDRVSLRNLMTARPVSR